MYQHSPTALLAGVFPEHEWLPWKFERISRDFWNNVNNQRKFMECAGKELKIKVMNDWYKVSVKDLVSVGGSSLLWKYKTSPSKILQAVYPEYPWRLWEFSNSPMEIWKNPAIVKEFFDWAGKELGIKELGDWRKVTTKALADLGYPFSIENMHKSLTLAYPEYQLINPKSATTYYKKSQFLLKSCIKALLPKEGININWCRVFIEIKRCLKNINIQIL